MMKSRAQKVTENLSCGAQLKCNGHRNNKDEKEIDVPIIILCVLYIYYTVYRGKLEKINERQHIIIYPKRSSGKVYRASHSVIFLI
jgi:hypothetical protein